MSEAGDESTRYRARLALAGGEVVEEPVVAVAKGRIRSIEPATGSTPGARDLGDVALVPGRVNAHSHAFQRAIRGRTEYLEGGRPEDDFWSWREKMYRAALALEPDQFEAVARQAFAEMVGVGITRVGEFHYVHHDTAGEPYDDPNELAKRMLRAAESVGIDITLLRAAYARAGYGEDPNPRQRRFREPSVETYLERVEGLRETARGREGVSVGLAPHSIRAVPGEWFEPIDEFAEAHGLPVHIHASEQPAELDQSRAEYGTTPITALEELGLLSERTTVIHATHATREELDRLGRAGASVCACPTTERNLGDGFLPAEGLLDRGVPVCLGTDSHADIDPWEEMRLVEYHERLRGGRRNVLAAYGPADGGGSRSSASAVWPMGGANGSRALGHDPSELRVGDRANFATVELSHPSIAGVDASTLSAHLVFAARPGAVRDVFVGGQPVRREGELVEADGDRIRRTFIETLRAIDL